MFTRAIKTQISRRAFSTTSANLSKVTVLGANGGIGQPLSLLLKQNKNVTDLRLYDLKGAPGVAADCSHVDTASVVKGFGPENNGIASALKGAEVVVIPAGMPRKPGMTRDDLFNFNASIVRDLTQAIAENCPEASICIISNPVNSMVATAAEVLKKNNVFNANKVFGVTTLDVVRSQRFVSEVAGGKVDPSTLTVPVVGGHSGETIVPLLSLIEPKTEIPQDKTAALIHRIQFGGDEVVQAKEGAGSATLSMAYAGARFAAGVLEGKNGNKVIQPAYVYLDGVDGGAEVKKQVDVDYFSVPIEFGPNGAKTIHSPLDKVSDAEKGLIKTAIDGLRGNIKKGAEFITNPPK